MSSMLGKVTNTPRDESGLVYSKKEILEEINKINDQEAFITSCLTNFNLDVFNVRYENAICQRNYVVDIARAIGFRDITLAERRLKKITGSTGSDWINRFQNEI